MYTYTSPVRPPVQFRPLVLCMRWRERWSEELIQALSGATCNPDSKVPLIEVGPDSQTPSWCMSLNSQPLGPLLDLLLQKVTARL